MGCSLCGPRIVHAGDSPPAVGDEVCACGAKRCPECGSSRALVLADGSPAMCEEVVTFERMETKEHPEGLAWHAQPCGWTREGYVPPPKAIVPTVCSVCGKPAETILSNGARAIGVCRAHYTPPAPAGWTAMRLLPEVG